MSTDAAIETSRRILDALSQTYPGSVSVRFWDGSMWHHHSEAPFTVVLKHNGSLRQMFWPFSRLSFGESYIFDDCDIEGDIFAFTDWLRYIVKESENLGVMAKLKLMKLLLKLPKQMNPRDLTKAGTPTDGDHSMARDKEAICYTYDLSAEFYKLFLDKNLQYTCGYCASETEDQDIAQERKMDLICRKLRLKGGEKYVDFGCGWGGLVIHAAKHYGVHATGVTLSKEQAKCAEAAIAENGLQDRVEIRLCDYREFNAPNEFDKASSVGMGEHIGNRNLPVFFEQIRNCLKPKGAYLHHSITLRPNTPYPRWTPFVRKYVFPNGELQTILHVLNSAAEVGFEIRDVEAMREQYVLTLEAWVRKLEANRDAVLKITDDVTYRIFRLYMAGATMGFRSGVYNLNQCLLIKPDGDASGVPLMRNDMYAGW